jgi:aminoglycoside 6'-N-acetyltransferase
MLKWLQSPHVKKWWDRDLTYTPQLVKEKYGSYVKGYKQVGGATKRISAYIICTNGRPVGYIQIYKLSDFPGHKIPNNWPENLGGFDVFIGEKEYIGKGIGSEVVTKFLKLYGGEYSCIFADPDLGNIAAIKAYEKAGFKKVSEQKDTNEVWMLYWIE